MTNSSDSSNRSQRRVEDLLTNALQGLRMQFHKRLGARLGVTIEQAWLESEIQQAGDRDIFDRALLRSQSLESRQRSWIFRLRDALFGRSRS